MVIEEVKSKKVKGKIWIFTFAFLLLPFYLVSAAPIFGSASGFYFAGAGSTITQSYDTGSGSNKYLDLCILDYGSSVASVTYAGASTPAIITLDDPTGHYTPYWFGLVGPTNGANNIVVNLASSGDNVLLGARYYTGVNPSTPLGTPAKSNGTVLTLSTTVTSATGDLGIDCMVGSSSSAITMSVISPQTQRVNQDEGSGSIRLIGTSEKTGATSLTMGWDFAGAFVFASHGVVSLKATTAAAVTRRKIIP